MELKIHAEKRISTRNLQDKRNPKLSNKKLKTAYTKKIPF